MVLRDRLVWDIDKMNNINSEPLEQTNHFTSRLSNNQILFDNDDVTIRVITSQNSNIDIIPKIGILSDTNLTKGQQLYLPYDDPITFNIPRLKLKCLISSLSGLLPTHDVRSLRSIYSNFVGSPMIATTFDEYVNMRNGTGYEKLNIIMRVKASSGNYYKFFKSNQKISIVI